MSYLEYTLEELGTVNRGRSKHRPRDDERLYGGQYPFIQTADVKNASLYITSNSQTYNEAGLAQSKLWGIGTLCITIAANIADTAILTFPACFPDSILGFIPYSDKADVKYIKYCFDILQKSFQTISHGATQDNLSIDKLLTVKFKIPSLPIQKRTADILSTYDDLIENNRKQIALLEETAQRFYKEWFVDFRFPGHEITKFVDGLPKDWKTMNLSDIADIVMGQSPKSEFYNQNNDGLPFHQGVGSYGTRFVVDNTYSTSYTRIANPGDILFSVRAPVGRLNITKHKIVIGRGLAAITHKAGLQSLLFYMLKERFYKDDIIGNGSIFASISKDELLEQKFLVPPNIIADQFNKISGLMDIKIAQLDEQLRLSSIARNALLPKLMTPRIEGMS